MRTRSVPVLLPTGLVLVVLGVWAGTSMGQVPPPPSVTLPVTTVSVPSVTVTVPTVPNPPRPPAPPPPPPPAVTVQVPPAPPPPRLPAVTTPAVTTPAATVAVPPPAPPRSPVGTPNGPVRVAGAGPGSDPAPPGTVEVEAPGQAQPASGAEAGVGTPAAGGHVGGASSRFIRISRVKTSRRYVRRGGPAAGRGLWVTFWLSGRATVVFRVDELAPHCRSAGRFLVRGRAGRNSVRFRGRVSGRLLDAGTYRLTAHPRGHRAQELAGATIVIAQRAAAPDEIASAEARNTCPGGVAPSLRDADAATGSTGGGDVAGVATAASSGGLYEDGVPGPVSSAVETITAAADAVPPVLIALALLAVILLAVAAMPQPVRASRASAALVHHRALIAMAGFAVFLLAVLSFTVL